MFNWTTTVINELPSFNNKEEGKLRIGKHLFEKRWVESISKAKGHDYKLCKATIDLSKVSFGTAKVARLYIYVGLEGSEESIYANDWYRKGMPLSVSFAVGAAADMAQAIADTVKTFNVFTKVKKVLDVKASGTVLTIEGTHEYQRLNKIAILVEDVDSKLGEEKAIVEWTLRDARYHAGEAEGALGAEAYATKTGVTLVEAGVNGFGTYSQLVKDLRLPTAANNNWLSVHKNEMPVVGALYTQYIINYYAPSTANPSFTAVGNRSMSETTHVFWVNTNAPAKDVNGDPSTVGAEWEKALASIDPDGGNLETVRGKVEGNFSNESLVD